MADKKVTMLLDVLFPAFVINVHINFAAIYHLNL